MTIRGDDDDGATAVEFAMVLPLVLVLFGTILTFALAMFYSAVAEYTARAGLRTAVLYSPNGYADQTAVQSTVDSSVPGILKGGTVASSPALASTAAAAGGQGDRVTVSVTYTISAISDAADLIPDIPGFKTLHNGMKNLAVVTRSATGRRE